VQVEHVAHKLTRRLTDQDGVRCGERLQARRQVRRLADDRVLLRGSGPDDLADNDQAGGDADACLQPPSVRPLDLADRRQHADCGADGALCRVLVGVRKTEIGKHAVAHELGDEPAKTAYGTGGSILIAPHQCAQRLWIDGACEFRGAHEIAEQYRDLAPLGLPRWHRSRRGVSRVRPGVVRDRLQEPAPVPERDTQFVEILRRQVRQNIEIDIIRFEGVGELLEPVSA
jgi:hypothetical protein